MSAYRYVVFALGTAPTAQELRRFRKYAEQLNNHIAYGVRKRDGALAVACEAEPFDRLRGLDPAFDELLLHWNARGAEVLEKLPFVKDTARWKAIEAAASPTAPSATRSTSSRSAGRTPDHRSTHAKSAGTSADRSDDELRREASAAVGVGRIEAAKAAARAEAYQRWAAALPYALWASAAVGLILSGLYVGNRLLNGPRERRADTVERIAADAINESLAPAVASDPNSTTDAPADTPTVPLQRPEVQP